MTQITAELTNYQEVFVRDRNGTVGTIYMGLIWDDTRGKFSDGTLVQTSLVQKVEDNLVYTLNSVYKLVGEPYKA
jgi:hypothetical protein